MAVCTPTERKPTGRPSYPVALKQTCVKLTEHDLAWAKDNLPDGLSAFVRDCLKSKREAESRAVAA